jgi:hypothetical protein
LRALCLAAGVVVARPIWLPSPARADGGGSDAGLPSVDIHGFGSQGFILSTGNEYLVADSKRGSFQLSEVGLNLIPSSRATTSTTAARPAT